MPGVGRLGGQGVQTIEYLCFVNVFVFVVVACPFCFFLLLSLVYVLLVYGYSLAVVWSVGWFVQPSLVNAIVLVARDRFARTPG